MTDELSKKPSVSLSHPPDHVLMCAYEMPSVPYDALKPFNSDKVVQAKEG